MKGAWTDDETKLALELSEDGVAFSLIAMRLGRNSQSVRDKLRSLRGMRRRVKANPSIQTVETRIEIPHECIAERDLRSSLSPRDLTAAFFGDPKPGYSALERRS